MAGSILFTGVEYVLEGTEGGGQPPVVITVAKNPVIIPKDPAA